MAARLVPLRDDRIDPACFGPPRLVHGGRRGEDFRAPGPHPCKRLGRRRTEMKAHHGGPELFEHVGGLRAEGRPASPLSNGARTEPELLEIGSERRSARQQGPRSRSRRPTAAWARPGTGSGAPLPAGIRFLQGVSSGLMTASPSRAATSQSRWSAQTKWSRGDT